MITHLTSLHQCHRWRFNRLCIHYSIILETMKNHTTSTWNFYQKIQTVFSIFCLIMMYWSHYFVFDKNPSMLYPFILRDKDTKEAQVDSNYLDSFLQSKTVSSVSVGFTRYVKRAKNKCLCHAKNIHFGEQGGLYSYSCIKHQI